MTTYIKAKEQARVTGMQSKSGLTCIETHKEAIIGMKTEAVDVFEQTPVIKEIIRAAKKGKYFGEIPSMKPPIV